MRIIDAPSRDVRRAVGFLCALALALSSSRILAQPKPAPPPAHPADAIGRVVTDTELVVVIEDPRSVLGSAPGRSVLTVLQALGQTAPFEAPWQDLAQTLGIDAAEQPARLLGRRLVLTMRDLDERRRWALRTDVDAATAQRIKARLDASPRELVAGHLVLSIEQGAYQLVQLPAQDGDAGATLVLAPAGGDGLLRETIRAHTTQRGRRLGETDALADARRLADEAGDGTPSVLVLGRIDQEAPQDPRPEGWSDYFAVSCDRLDDGWSMRLVLRDSSFASMMRADPKRRWLEPWSDAPFDAMRDGAIAAVLEGGGLPWNVDASNPLSVVMDWLRLPTEVTDATNGRQAFVLRPGARGEGVTCALAFEADRSDGFVRAADDYLRDQLRTLEAQFGEPMPSGLPAPTAIPAGFLPEAIRIERIRGALGSLPTLRQPAVCWAYPPIDDGRCWWTIAIVTRAPAGASPDLSVRSVCEQLVSQHDEARIERWLSIGAVRPDAFASLGLPLLPPTWSDAMRRMSNVDWALRLTEFHDVEGEIRVRLHAADDDGP